MQFRDRHALPEIQDALSASRIVAVLGPRQSGKTTIARHLVTNGTLSHYVTLDDERARDAARDDVVGFVASLPHGSVIDEVQRLPDLLLELKRVVDLGDQRPGRFLLTGSGDLRRLRSIPDVLPGRVEFVEVLPFTQGELRGVPDAFVDRVFDREATDVTDGAPPVDAAREAVAELLVTGGYPGAQDRSDRRLESFFASYLQGMAADAPLPQEEQPRRPERVVELLRVVAPRSSQLLNVADAAGSLAASERSVRAWIELLAAMYLLHVLPSWHVNLDQRRVKRPKLVVADSGILCHLLGADAKGLLANPVLLGQVLESFVVAELQRQSTWARRPYRLFHFRDRDGREVDIVAERPDGSIVTIELKATSTPRAEHVAGLRHVRDIAGSRWAGGVLLTLSPERRVTSDGIVMAPLSALWGG